MEIKNLKKAAKRILKAIKNKEKIILYGDADMDGVSSVIILKETIKNLGGEIKTVYFPDREKEGYGINKIALNYLKDKAPALFIVLDCGIGNFEEAKLAKKLGFSLIIIDHHEVLNKLPEAEIIVDPKQKGDKYPFKGLAATGVAYKLSQALFKENISESLKKNFLELVALATIADMMPQESENRIMIEEGLASLENSFRPGLKVFFTRQVENYGTIRQISQKIISVLNTAEVKNHLNEAYLLLTSGSIEQAEILAKELIEKGYQKQERVREITEEVEERIFKKIDEPIIFEGDSSWPLILLGSVASRTCNLHKKPVFLYKIGEIESPGTVRTPKGIDGVKAMGSCQKLLETYGGHPVAAGFRIKNKNLEKFKERLINYFAN